MEEKEFEIDEKLKNIEILLRVNNILMTRFIVTFNNIFRRFNLPKCLTFFKFEILEDDYKALVSEFKKESVDKALYNLDRLLLANKIDCPNNIAKYIRTKIKNSVKRANKRKT